MKTQLSSEETKKLAGKCPKCNSDHFVGTIARDNETDETVIIDGIELMLFYCHDCNQYFIKKSKESNKIYILEVRVKGQNPHFQAVFTNDSLAYEAKNKYLNDPACKRDLMEADIHAFKVHTDLTVLDSSRPVEVVNDNVYYYYDGLTRTHTECDSCGKVTDCGKVTSNTPYFVKYFCSDSCYDNWKESADR